MYDLPQGIEGIFLFCVALWYVFAAGRIAEFLKQQGGQLSRKEAVLVPFAYVLFACIGLLIYFSSGAWEPPQHTPITLGAYLVLFPLAVATVAGAIAIHSFFHDRLHILSSLDLSMKITLSPLFDGLSGYWTALWAAAILAAISWLSFWSSRGNFSLATNDFIILSIICAAYYVYKAAVSQASEERAASVVTMLVIISPAVLRIYFKGIACALLSLIPLQFFKTCPLEQIGSDLTLALSVLATLVLTIPVIPIVYAAMVNLMRACSLASAIMKDGGRKPKRKKEDDE